MGGLASETAVESSLENIRTPDSDGVDSVSPLINKTKSTATGKRHDLGSKRKMETVGEIPTRKRERISAPFSPRHEENNRMSLRHSSRKRTPPIPVRHDHSESALPSSRTRASSEVQTSLSRDKNRSESAKKHIRRLETVTKNIERRISETGDSSGIIKSIKMFNFMCHKSFEQKWHENINFVIGENGSGKSALLSALMIGLGGKALSTSRTSSVKDLIKTGETHAKTVICLLNHGKLPIEKYGEEISIERTINQQGQSSYKLKYGAGAKPKPATKHELDNLLRLLDIQLENPVVVLNQEYARSFLRSKDPKDKYKLFEEGTGTADCDKMQAQVKEILGEVAVSLRKKKEEVKALRKNKQELEKRIALIDGISSHAAKLHELENERGWYHVEVEEKKEDRFKKEMGKAQQKLSDSEASYQKGVEKKIQMENDSSKPDDDRNEQMRKKSDLERRASGVQREINNLNTEKVRCEMTVKSKKLAVEGKEKHLKRVEEKMQSYEDTARNDRDREMSRYHAAKEELAGKISENQRTLQTLKDEKDLFSTGAQALRTNIDGTLSSRETIKRQIADKNRQLAQMRSNSSAAYAVFGNQMSSLMSKIGQAKRRFTQMPKGPLGACITIKDPKYVDIIQNVLGNKVADFVVGNPSDAKVLNELIEQSYGKRFVPGVLRPSVTMLKFSAAYDCSQRNASRGTKFITIYDMIEFDNDDHIIKNALLDIASIERILLFKTQLDALDILTYREKVPRTCTGAYSLDFYSIKPDPNLRITPLNNKPQTKLIKSSQKTQKRYLQDELGALSEELENYIVPPSDIEEEKRLRNEAAKRDEEYHRIRNIVSSLKHRHDSLKEPPNRLADHASLVEELAEVKLEIESFRAEIDTSSEILEQRKASILTKQDQKKEINSEIDEIDKAIVRAMESNDKRKEKMDKLESFVVQLSKKVDKEKEEVASAAQKLSVVTAKIVEVKTAASRLGERVPEPRNDTVIKAEYDSLKAEIAQLEKLKDKHGNIKERYKAVNERYTKYATDLDLVTVMFDKVVRYFQIVSVRYLHARDQCVLALQQCYEGIAKARKYHGKLLIDHEQRELFYLICPDKESLEKIEKHEKNRAKYKSKMVEYASGLSGGERSFSTICFIIAMWQAMKTPFYMLDEFDVFMDAQNRTVSQEALMSHAKLHPNNQFFFFTPLDLTSVPASGEATVLKLYPPERNQAESSVAEAGGADVPSTSKNRKRGRGTQEAGPSKAPRL